MNRNAIDKEQLTRPHFAARLWTYQRERFPVFGHGALVAAFSFSAVAYSAMLRGPTTFPSIGAASIAFCSSFIFFLQLRIADEFKDFDEDSRFRPYRPVPRGLIQLRELAWVGSAGAAIQLVMALIWQPKMVGLLLGVWLYMALMSREFFAREWLKVRPITYMWTHMLVMPLADFYATSCDWLHVQNRAPTGLGWFLIMSLFNGFVIEIGRKIRAPESEETGVQTYSVLWGPKAASVVWMGMMFVSSIAALLAASRIHSLPEMLGLLTVLLALIGIAVARFWRQPIPSRARWIEPLAGLWTLLTYLGIGVAPLAQRAWSAAR